MVLTKLSKRDGLEANTKRTLRPPSLNHFGSFPCPLQHKDMANLSHSLFAWLRSTKIQQILVTIYPSISLTSQC